ncbi:hypothetical protein PMI12_01946 [Variovorax sp. CF313]|jgi:hypothetical protein|nr:hypothetical protein PMI12_01946 [Variovorax sp. CF313]
MGLLRTLEGFGGVCEGRTSDNTQRIVKSDA